MNPSSSNLSSNPSQDPSRHPSLVLFERLKKTRLVAMLAPESPEACVAAFEALDPLGVVLEVALRTPAALEGIRAVKGKHPGALVMAGTVLTVGQAEEAMAAGVAGIVSPDYFPDVVASCVRRDVMAVPGGLADAGKQLALKAALYRVDMEGLRRGYPYQWIYKFFPAVAGGLAGLGASAAWKAVYKGLCIVYTGGVTEENAFLIARRDPEGILCASALTRHAGDPGRMREDAERWLGLIHGGGGSALSQGAPSGGAGGVEVAAQPSTVVTFGEIMARLDPGPGVRLVQSSRFDVHFGGSEANVAAGLAGFGVPARFVTALPPNDLGRAAASALQRWGVDMSQVLWQGSRLGLYFLEEGASQRPSKVIYDRAGSAITTLEPGRIDWGAALEGARWFHVSGITPALGRGLAAVTREALEAAKDNGLTVSLDLNYRSRLWTREEARRTLTPLAELADIVIGNERDAADVFGIDAGASGARSGKLDVSGYEAAARELVDRFSLKLAAVTLRESLSASDNGWSACLFDGSSFHTSRKYTIHVVDRVGGGDAFSAGLIFGMLQGKLPKEALEFGTAASCLKQTIRGDFNCVSPEEVEALADGDASGRIRR